MPLLTRAPLGPYYKTKLDPVDAEDLDAPLRPEELDVAIKQHGKNKTPGIDGLTFEFFSSFWPLFKNDLFEVFQSAVASNILPNSFHKAVITLIPKKGRPLRYF